jgi:hypothetical protein
MISFAIAYNERCLSLIVCLWVGVCHEFICEFEKEKQTKKCKGRGRKKEIRLKERLKE